MAIFQQVPRAAAAADEAVALARNIAGKDAAAAAGARGASLLAKGFQTEIQSLEEMLKHSSALRDPANAAKVWDKTYQEIAQNAKFKGMPIGPNNKTITYQMPDGSMKVLSITEKPPLGAQRISMTDDELRAIMPPRPKPPAEATPRPANAYNEPRPAGMEPPTAAASAPTEEAVRVAQQAASGARSGPWFNPPTPGMSRPPNVGARASVEAGAGQPGQDMMQILGRYGLPAAGAATGAYMLQPRPNYDAMTSEEMVNPPATLGYGYSGSTVSPDESDFAATGAAQYHMRGPLADRINPDMEQVYQRQGPLADRSPAPTVQRALTASRAAAPTVASGTGQTASPEAASPSMLAQIIRGRFGEAAKEDPNKLTAAQEARDRGMASGGSVEPKPPKDAALHKALEIIHHLIRRG